MVLAFVLNCSPLAWALERANPEEIGLSSEKLNNLTVYLQQEVESGRMAGAVGIVVRHGRIGYLESVGYHDLESRKEMENDSLFRIASMTKAITAAAVMSLVDEGRLKLDDPVSKYLPEFESLRVIKDLEGEGLETVAAETPITIHQLMAHVSGVHYGWFGPEKIDTQYRESNLSEVFVPINETMRERVARIAANPLKHQPGTAWEYGFSSDILGCVVEEISGLRLDQFLYERIFRPLRMGDSHFKVPEEKQQRLASLYTIDEVETLVKVGAEPITNAFLTFTEDFCYRGNGAFLSGGGGMVSSTMDYARFLQMLLNGGTFEGARILNPESVGIMTENQIGNLRIPFERHGDGYGYGFGVLTQRGKDKDVASVGTFSWGGIFNTYYWVDPQEEMIGILMTQVFPFFHLNLREAFKRLAYEAIDDSGFSKRTWYEKGIENGNPFFNGRQLRVNAPEVSVHERFAIRSEPRSSGLARILIEEDLRDIRRADLYCEVWGGHPGTANKRVSVNGRNQLSFPRVGCEEKNCTHLYPAFNLRPIDLVNGYNSLQFACDSGSTFWGHYIVDNVCLQIGLPDDHAVLTESGLEDFNVVLQVTPKPGRELIELRLKGTSNALKQVDKVVYQARYYGYDENGNRRESDWHGMTKGREFYGMIGESEKRPFLVNWETRMLPAQPEIQFRAFLTFKTDLELLYQTPVLGGVEIPERRNSEVSIHYAKDLPQPFWSRAGNRKSGSIELDFSPSEVESAALQVVCWTGGAGEVENYFTLNGQHFPVAEGHDHQLVYSSFEVDSSLLRKGENRLELISDTEHHGIEVMLPGPALVIRKRIESK